MTTDNILLALVAITGVSVLVQLIVLVAIFVMIRKGMNEARAKADEVRSAVMPVFETTRNLINKIEPKIDSAAGDLALITHDLKIQTSKLQVAADDAVGRFSRQAARVDTMTTSVLNNVDRIGTQVGEAVRVPIRQASALIAGARAALDTLRAPSAPRQRTANEAQTPPAQPAATPVTPAAAPLNAAVPAGPAATSTAAATPTGLGIAASRPIGQTPIAPRPITQSQVVQGTSVPKPVVQPGGAITSQTPVVPKPVAEKPVVPVAPAEDKDLYV